MIVAQPHCCADLRDTHMEAMWLREPVPRGHPHGCCWLVELVCVVPKGFIANFVFMPRSFEILPPRVARTSYDL